MAARKSFLLRLDHGTYEAVARWASDDLRSVNGQLEFLIRRALTDAGRLPARSGATSTRSDGSGRERTGSSPGPDVSMDASG